ncbi:MAG: sensor histidine kinase, partial [Lachnospiraceae bacterium]|nr:sensor histidine kinase [Lachnospiraceae bacterium]
KNSCDIQQLLQESCTDMQGATEDIVIEGSILQATLQNVDENRILQCIENIISKARKYAKESPIYVTTVYRKIEEQEYYEISFQDQGGGIADADMPFIFDKFYRGKNVEKEPGAGLGLFIVKYLMEQMKGEVSVENKEGGVCVHLYFSIHCDKL